MRRRLPVMFEEWCLSPTRGREERGRRAKVAETEVPTLPEAMSHALAATSDFAGMAFAADAGTKGTRSPR
jgi:hypothetical protein